VVRRSDAVQFLLEAWDLLEVNMIKKVGVCTKMNLEIWWTMITTTRRGRNSKSSLHFIWLVAMEVNLNSRSMNNRLNPDEVENNHVSGHYDVQEKHQQ
jgi:hypothetical protein